MEALSDDSVFFGGEQVVSVQVVLLCKQRAARRELRQNLRKKIIETTKKFKRKQLKFFCSHKFSNTLRFGSNLPVAHMLKSRLSAESRLLYCVHGEPCQVPPGG